MPGNSRKWIFHILYIAIGVLTIAIPFNAHSGKLGGCAGLPGVEHFALFHFESLPAKEIFTERDGDMYVYERHHLSGPEVWEAAAILQALLFSLLLLFEAEARMFRKKIILPLMCLVILNVATLVVLFRGQIAAYQWFVLATIVGFCVEDYLLLREARSGGEETRLYKMLLSYVDIPILMAMVVLCWHLGIPYVEGSESFFGGAVAFQLIFGNVAIFMIRQYKEVEKASRVGELVRSLLKP